MIRIRPGDTVIFSANPIPGNTIAVVNCIDKLMIQGANVIYGRDKGIHVSGHGCQEDQKLMLALTKPKFFVPVHGEHRMLVKHSQTAQSMGIPAENMLIIDNGDIIELTQNSLKKAGKVPSGIQLVDQAGVVHENVMQERQQLAEDGVITIAATVDGQGKPLVAPEINLRGVVTTVERTLLQQLIGRSLEQLLNERCPLLPEKPRRADWEALRGEIEGYIQRLVKRELRSSPLVVFLLQTTDLPETVAEETPVPITQGSQVPVEVPVVEKEVSESVTGRTYRRRRSTASIAS